jgi:DNA-binding Lrp family transcriptional regulator
MQLISLLATEVVQFDSYYKRWSEVSDLLDPLNVRILGCISQVGPRNLLEVSRRTRIPFSTVYHRVARFEKRIGRIGYLVPRFSKLGLTCLVVLGRAKPGREEQLSAALKLPNYWWSVTRCEGGFTNHSAHCVPVQHVKTFYRYIRRVSLSGLADRIQTVRVGDYAPFSLNFKHYNAAERTWEFTWDKWFEGLMHQKVVERARDPANYVEVTSKHDLLIVKELQKNGRTTLAELASLLNMTLPGAKYHYDKLLARGVCDNFWVNIFPYPIEISAVYDIMIDFSTPEKMNKFYSFIPKLSFIIDITKVLARNSLLARAYIPEMQVSNMFDFLSQATRKKAWASYSALRLRFETRKSQTISYELFDDRKKTWRFDLGECVTALRKIS